MKSFPYSPIFFLQQTKQSRYLNSGPSARPRRGHLCKQRQGVLSKSNFQYTNPNKRKQVLHIIEDVLEPLRSLTGDHYNPDAYELLSSYNSYELQPHSLSKFRKCVEDYNKGSAFKSDSRYTFFIPVDAGFEDPTNRAGAIDEKIIDGHIIPHHVLFTKPTPFDSQYETLAFW
ncbi:hypothetical protein WDU94_006691 [Cyamophila willieti]